MSRPGSPEQRPLVQGVDAPATYSGGSPPTSPSTNTPYSRGDVASTPPLLGVQALPRKALSGSTDQIHDTAALSGRLKYYRRLSDTSRRRPSGDNAGFDFEHAPQHVVPAALFVGTTNPGEQSSIRTIFSIVNTMVGSTILVMPWGFQQSGLVGGLALIFMCGGMLLYTCHLIEFSCRGWYDAFDDLLEKSLGLSGFYAAKISSVCVLYGAVMACE